MRLILSVLAALALINATLAVLERSASSERARLAESAATLSRRAEDARASSERRREIDSLVERARAHAEDPRDIGTLRDVLVSAERDLDVDRLSLDFRPEEQLPPGLGGARVVASLRGRFDAVYDYLGRVEAEFLPMALDSLTLRGDSTSVTLTVVWAARWAQAGGSAPAEPTLPEVAELGAWLDRAPAPRPERNVFSYKRAATTGERIDEVASPPPSASNDLAREPAPERAEPERPVLKGFVLARPELEPDVKRRVLAALRYEGETRLVMVGDTVGAFVVDSMEARDSVTLTRADTGERIRLTLQ